MAEEKKVKKDHGKWFREMRSELKKLCSVAVGACIWIFDGVAMLLIKTLIGAFTG